MGIGPVSSMRIGILTALPIEARTISYRPIKIGETRQINSRVVLHVSGVGEERARIGAKHLLEAGVDGLVSWGCAGGLDSTVSSGSIVIPEKIVDQDYQEWMSDSHLHSPIIHRLSQEFKLHHGVLFHSRQVINSIAIKSQIAHQFQAMSVDMESAAIAKVAKQAGIAFTSVRAIADSAEISLPVWLNRTLHPDGKARPWIFWQELMRHPQSWRSMNHLRAGFAKAQSSLKLAAGLLGWR